MLSRLFESINQILFMATRHTHPHTIRLFRIVAYSWCLLHTLLLLPIAGQVWGANAYVPALVPQGFFGHLIGLLHLPGLARFYPAFLAAQIVFLVLGIIGYSPRIISLAIYILTVNIHNRAYSMLDGGDNVMALLLFYLIFMKPQDNHETQSTRSECVFSLIGNAISNSAFLMARIQIALVYLVAGLAKTTGGLWQKGTALLYTLHVDTYSMPLARDFIEISPAISVLGSYGTIAFQLAFPWLIWFRKTRPYILFIGTCLHLSISIFMGLFTFGLAMATAYVLFYHDNKSVRILRLPERVINAVRKRTRLRQEGALEA